MMKNLEAKVPKNKKIKNASNLFKHGIHFKSKLELMCYEVLREHGFKPKYEKEKYVLQSSFVPGKHNVFYKTGNAKMLVKDDRKVMAITYTPDFTFNYKNVHIVIEAKGYPNDTYAIKRKMFRWCLELNAHPTMFFEVHSRRSLETAIEVIKSL